MSLGFIGSTGFSLVLIYRRLFSSKNASILRFDKGCAACADALHLFCLCALLRHPTDDLHPLGHQGIGGIAMFTAPANWPAVCQRRLIEVSVTAGHHEASGASHIFVSQNKGSTNRPFSERFWSVCFCVCLPLSPPPPPQLALLIHRSRLHVGQAN